MAGTNAWRVKEIVDQFTWEFENRTRLAIMATLARRERVDFGTLKELLNVTDGNLSSHLSVLEKQRFLKSAKSFVGKKPSTTYTITDRGRRAFQQHVNALQSLLQPSSSS